MSRIRVWGYCLVGPRVGYDQLRTYSELSCQIMCLPVQPSRVSGYRTRVIRHQASKPKNLGPMGSHSTHSSVPRPTDRA